MDELRQIAESMGLLRDLPRTFALWGILYVVFGLAELALPAQAGHSVTGRVRNITLTLIATVFGTCTSQALLQHWGLQGRLVSERGLGFSVAAALVTVFVTDLVFYGYHRLQHESKLLWPLHELHHSDAELNVTTSLRAHWLDRFLQSLIIGFPIGFVLQLDQRAALWLSLTLPAWHFFAHANLRLSMGPLSPWFCGPQVHRVHHSILPQHRNRNYAQFFPFIDRVFGTYYAPRPNEFPPTGAPDLPSNASLLTVMVRPLQSWWSMLRARF